MSQHGNCCDEVTQVKRAWWSLQGGAPGPPGEEVEWPPQEQATPRGLPPNHCSVRLQDQHTTLLTTTLTCCDKYYYLCLQKSSTNLQY